MLKGKDCGGHKNCDLLSIVHCLESSTNGDFCFAKANISTNQSIHGLFTFHVFFNCRCGISLIGGVFVDKGCFQLVLQITIRMTFKTFFKFPFCIDLNEVESNFFHPFLCFCFQFFPCDRSKFVNFRNSTIFSRVFTDFVQ